MSPRRFDRRTYMIVAPGWSALAFKAAMSASSASTTIRSAFPFTLSPTVNCHDIFGLPQGARLRTSAHRHRPIPCVRARSLCAWGCRVAEHSARTPICTKIESGADAGSRGITCYMVRPTRASCIGISQQWRASLTDGNSVTPAQVTSKREPRLLTHLSLSVGGQPHENYGNNNHHRGLVAYRLDSGISARH